MTCDCNVQVIGSHLPESQNCHTRNTVPDDVEVREARYQCWRTMQIGTSLHNKPDDRFLGMLELLREST
jgi:hypothetical protein